MCRSHHSPQNPRRDFRVHLVNYVLAVGTMWVIWFASGPGVHPWPIYPTMGWGLGILGHYIGMKKSLPTPPSRPKATSHWEDWDGQAVQVHEKQV